MLIEGLGLEEATAVSTPGEDDKNWEREENAEELEGTKAKVFRGHAARLNYIATDRPDIAYSAKEICRYMAKPISDAFSIRCLFMHSRAHCLSYYQVVVRLDYRLCVFYYRSYLLISLLG